MTFDNGKKDVNFTVSFSLDKSVSVRLSLFFSSTNFLLLQFVQELFFAYRIPSTNHGTDLDENWCVATSCQTPGINRSTILIFDP